MMSTIDLVALCMLGTLTVVAVFRWQHWKLEAEGNRKAADAWRYQYEQAVRSR